MELQQWLDFKRSGENARRLAKDNEEQEKEIGCS
jgi:hypothetical protein